MTITPPKNTYQSFVIGDGEIDVHPLHGAKELSGNLDVTNALLTIDPKVKIKLLPVIDINSEKAVEMIKTKKKFYPKDYFNTFDITKNPDAIVNGKVADFKNVNGSKTSVRHAIRNGKIQADFVIIKTPNNASLDEVERYVKGQIKHYEDKENLKIWVINDSEKREYITKPKSK